MYAEDPSEAKYELLISKSKGWDIKYCNDFKAFISYLNDIGDIYKNIEEDNPNKKGKIFIVLHDMTADTLCHKKLNLTVTELFIRGRKLKISPVSIT